MLEKEKKILRGKTVLIIDDEEQIREIIAEIFRMEGIEPLLAADGEEGIKLFQEKIDAGGTVDCIVADLTIPGGMGGKEAVDILRNKGVPFKAVVTSGYNRDPVIIEYRESGFDAAITKPFSISELISLLKEIL
ncbi:MAG: response regulator [Spirochaetota bacterium]